MAGIADDIEAFLKRHDMKPTRFGQLAMNDKAFVHQVRKGRRVWPDSEARVREFMRLQDEGLALENAS